ncbi:MAG: sigma-70 family RNA polymerase sigma factor [Bacteroidia bacterium]|jgi:RNA polymerase sigma-70 factor (ECF subfamily)|nr:sigma-70 family RNA polymerase sigma factor [Bacteroidia bacterium]
MIKRVNRTLKLKHNILDDETELVKRCIHEDRVAQHALFKAYSSAMMGVCMRYAGNKEEAEDILQEGFIAVFNHLKTFKFQSSLKTWITRIMINTALNYLRKYKKMKFENAEYNEVAEPDVQVFQLQLYDQSVVMKCIQELPEGYRIVINMFAIEGYSHKEIADTLNIQESTSRSQFAKAKVSLIKKLKTYGINVKLNEVRSI